MDYSMSFDPLSAGLNLASLGYNIFSGERNRKDYLAQQSFSNDVTLNAMQYRVADMRKAGLHPTLAAGQQGATTPPVGASGASNVHGGSGLSNVILGAQLDKLKAEKKNLDSQSATNFANAARSLADLRRIRQGIQLDANADSRAQALVDQSAERLRSDVSVNNQRIDTLKKEALLSEYRATMQKYENDYYHDFGTHIPPAAAIGLKERWLTRISKMVSEPVKEWLMYKLSQPEYDPESNQLYRTIKLPHPYKRGLKLKYRDPTPLPLP